MTRTIRSSEKLLKKSTFDIVLERLDNRRQVGFVLADGSGRKSPFAISRSPYPRASLQTYQGQAGFDNQEPPYRTIIQQDTTGGRGQLNFESDATRFFDSTNLHSQSPGKIMLGGNPQFASGYMAGLTQDPPTSLSWVQLSSTSLYTARKFTAGATGTSFTTLVYVRAYGSPGDLALHLYSDTTGEPNASLGNATLASSSVVPDQAELRPFTISASLSASTVYHVVATVSGTNDTDNYWQIGVDSTNSSDGNISADGSSWSTSTSAPWYIIYENVTSAFIRDIIPLTYKQQQYGIVRYTDGANSFLYMAGDRGAADSNSGDKTKLNDATKSWTTNAYAGDVVLITAGPGSEEEKPWRTISSNNGTSLTVSSAWNVAHTTSTEYAILGTSFTSLQDLGGDVTDYALAGDSIYFARGDSTSLMRYQAYNKTSGVWTARSATEDVSGSILLSQREPDTDEYLWVARNEDSDIGVPNVQRYSVPQAWGKLYQIDSTVARTSEAWTEYYESELTLTAPDILQLGISGANNLIAAKDLDAPIDTAGATSLHALMKWDTHTAETVTLSLSDVRWEDRRISPSSIKLARAQYKLPAGVFHIASGSSPTDMRWYDGTNWFHMSNAPEGDYKSGVYFLIADTADYVYVGHSQPFDTIYVAMDATSFNNNAATVSVEEWQGSGWYSVSGETDGTASGGATLAQSGSLTWTTGEAFQAGSDDATNLDQTLHWVRLSFSAALDATVVEMLRVEHSVRPWMTVQTNSAARSADANDVSSQAISRMTSSDYIYILGQSPFDDVYVNMGATVNAVTATSSVEYFDGEKFVAVTGFTDGTLSSGKTLAQDGAITFNLPEDMSVLTVNGVEGYCVRIKPSTTLTNFLEILTISTKNTLQPDYISLDEMGAAGSLAQEFGNTLEMQSGDYLYFSAGSRFDKIYFNHDSTIKNNNAATLSGEYYNGFGWTAFTSFTDGTAATGAPFGTTGDSVSITFETDQNLMQQCVIDGGSGYWVRIKTSADLDPVQIWRVGLGREQTIDVTLTTESIIDGEWSSYLGNLPGYGTFRNGVDERSIVCVIVDVTDPNADTNLSFRGNIHLVNLGGFVVSGFGPTSDRITGMELYGQGRQNPWVLTEGGIYEIQTQLGSDVAPIPLREFSTLRNPKNGRASTTNDTYLYVNLGSHIQRYFNGSLDNVGWNREEGVPSNRGGDVSFLLSSPGGVYGGLDAGATGYSALMYGQSRAWHNAWLAPYGLSVNAGGIQPIPGPTPDRIWLSVGPLLLYIPLPSETFDPTKDSNYLYAPEGHLTTSWISAGLYTIKKLFKGMSLFTENLSSDITIRVSYQTESADWDDTWTKITDDFDASPVEDHDIAALMVTARRIRFRFSLRTNDQTTSPIMYAWALDSLIRFPTKFSYTFQHRISNYDDDLRGVRRSDLVATAWVSTLDALASELVACKVHSKTFPDIDGRTVVVEPSGMREIPASGNERSYIIETTLLEV